MCQRYKSPYVRRKEHLMSEEKLFPFWSAWPSKGVTRNRMLKQEATLSLGLLVTHDGLCLISVGGGLCRCSSPGSHPVGQLSVHASLGTLIACAHSSSPPAAARDFADVPPRAGSCSSQTPCFHLPGGPAPPGRDGAADSSSPPRPFLFQGLSSSQRKRGYSVPFPRIYWPHSY